MCGIGLVWRGNTPVLLADPTTVHTFQQGSSWEYEIDEQFEERWVQLLSSRGPDVCQQHHISCENGSLQMHGAVLHLRGDDAAAQPLIDATTGDVLLWNGEVFGNVPAVPLHSSDTTEVMNALSQRQNKEEGRSVIDVLAGIEGPWATVYWSASERALYLGRDPWGRRSLLLSFRASFSPEEGSSQCTGTLSSLLISSVVPDTVDRESVIEIPTTGLMKVSFPMEEESALRIEHLPWQHVLDAAVSTSPLEPFMETLPVVRPPVIGNGCNASCPTGCPGLMETISEEIVDAFLERFLDAVRRRVDSIANYQRSAVSAHPVDDKSDAEPLILAPARVAVMFSGGIDSMLIAAAVDKFLPEDEPIDLINVAFGSDPTNVPDRISGQNGLVELQAINAKREWRFVEVDIRTADVEDQRHHVLELLSPSDTVMDFNIGTVFFFAAKGEGCFRPNVAYAHRTHESCRYGRHSDGTEGQSSSDDPDTVTGAEDDVDTRDTPVAAYHYTSSAKVFLVGLGADEQMAGYGRHRTTFTKRGWSGLAAELEMDVRRLWKRNLGRDDRICSDAARELRHPFLDEQLTAFLQAQPMHNICNLNEPLGIGDKKVLRLAARKLGLGASASLQKRAIQFGTRIANRLVAGYAKMDGTVRVTEVLNRNLNDTEKKVVVPKGISKKVLKRKTES